MLRADWRRGGGELETGVLGRRYSHCTGHVDVLYNHASHTTERACRRGSDSRW